MEFYPSSLIKIGEKEGEMGNKRSVTIGPKHYQILKWRTSTRVDRKPIKHPIQTPRNLSPKPIPIPAPRRCLRLPFYRFPRGRGNRGSKLAAKSLLRRSKSLHFSIRNEFINEHTFSKYNSLFK